MGYGLSEALLWTPDLGHAIIAVAGLAVVLAVVKIVVTVRKSTGATR